MAEHGAVLSHNVLYTTIVCVRMRARMHAHTHRHTLSRGIMRVGGLGFQVCVCVCTHDVHTTVNSPNTSFPTTWPGVKVIIDRCLSTPAVWLTIHPGVALGVCCLVLYAGRLHKKRNQARCLRRHLNWSYIYIEKTVDLKRLFETRSTTFSLMLWVGVGWESGWYPGC